MIDKSIAADLDGMAKLSPGGDASLVARTADDKQWIVATSTEQKPGDYWLWNRTSRKGTFLFSSRPELANYKMATMKPVEIPSRDGLTLVGYLTLPTDSHADGPAKPTATPMILLVHGGPWARDNWGPNPFRHYSVPGSSARPRTAVDEQDRRRFAVGGPGHQRGCRSVGSGSHRG